MSGIDHLNGAGLRMLADSNRCFRNTRLSPAQVQDIRNEANVTFESQEAEFRELVRQGRAVDRFTR